MSEMVFLRKNSPLIERFPQYWQKDDFNVLMTSAKSLRSSWTNSIDRPGIFLIKKHPWSQRERTSWWIQFRSKWLKKTTWTCFADLCKFMQSRPNSLVENALREIKREKVLISRNIKGYLTFKIPKKVFFKLNYENNVPWRWD